jgi:hypothetical protein
LPLEQTLFTLSPPYDVDYEKYPHGETVCHLG